MTDLNTVSIVGRLTKTVGEDEFSFGYLQNGTARATLSIAVNSAKKDSNGQWIEEASFFEVTIFGKMAENLKPYLSKGQQVAVQGKLKQDRWEKDGRKGSKVYILADTVQLLGGKGESNNQSSTGGASTFKPNPKADNGNMYGDSGEFPEDVPF